MIKKKERHMITVSIVTATYNRGHFLPLLYDSIRNQDIITAFEWLIIDDGSTDDTLSVVEKIKKQNNGLFPIRYYHKSNGGKHTAINLGIKEALGELFFIVDSDDILTANAIETILNDWERVRNKGLCGIGYLRGYSEEDIIGASYSKDGFIGNFIDERFNKGVSGDKAEVWVTQYLREYGGFPVFDGERFISESVLWIKISRSHDMLFRNKIIYITEYLEGGLSQVGRTLRFKCPQGMAYGSLETMSKEFSLKIRIKEALLYIVYSKFGGIGLKNILKCPYPLLVLFVYLPGLLLFHYWKRKYKM